MMFFLLSVLTLVACSQAQIVKLGPCPDLPVQQNFQVPLYTGIWYEYERYFAAFQQNSSCTYANYTLKPDGKIDVVNSGINRFTGNPSSAHGEAYPKDSAEPAKLLVKFDRSPRAGQYWVLDTDYTNYSIVYSCRNLNSRVAKKRAEIVWILSRRRGGPGGPFVQKAEGVLRKPGISTCFLMKTKQENCTNGDTNMNF